ncbi:RraA family protein [Phenylobacterium sp.]|uniref:RraA family protein n=1 Tax=Phenylobacterium sp. TaxID=1871053 RepID=UPI002EDB2B47
MGGDLAQPTSDRALTRPGDGLVAAAAALSSASLHEAARRAGALPGVLKPIDLTMRLCGRALPVRCPAGDNLWIHRALAEAEPGEVLVVETGAGVEFGYWGEIMATAAIARGVAGLVITGGVRDSLRLVELGLPTFSAGISIRGTAKDPAGAGAVGEPVRIGEVVVRRGDLVFGDADGVVVLGPEAAAAAVPAAAKRDADEVAILEQVRAGALTLDVYKL